MSDYKKLFHLLRPYTLKIILIVILNLLYVFFSIVSISLLAPFLSLIFNQIPQVIEKPALAFSFNDLMLYVQYLLSQVIISKGLFAALFILISCVFVFFLLKNVFYYLSTWLLIPIRGNIIKDLRNKIYAHILILPLSFYSENRKGDVLTRAITDVQDVDTYIFQSFQQLFRDPINVLLFLFTLFFINFKFTLFILIILPLAGFIINRLQRKLKQKSLEAKTHQSEMLSTTEESIYGLRIIKGFNAIDNMFKHFSKFNKSYSKQIIKVNRRRDLSSPMSEFLGSSVVIFILLLGGYMVLEGDSRFTAEMFITYIVLFTQIINPAKNISEASANLKKGLASFLRIETLLQSDVKIFEKPNARIISSFNKEIEFQNVSFAYEEKTVLNDINLIIPKGKTIALCGSSGSGKSTLIHLLPRFYDVVEGSILIDGVNIKDFNLNSLRSLFGIVSQENILFNDTIFNNIAFGVKNIDKEKVINAAKIANVYDFISELEDGFDTIVGDRGIKLSGGQKQRISIARAILNNPPILILDEATSSLDSESEALIQNALNKLMKNRTSIVIAHRLSTIATADEIIVLEQGKIVERGNHQTLIEKNGLYSNLLRTSLS
ncbi:MAG TPA: ABC transporter ATP-binding protein [Bacteroidales bacterium]|jgi:subfamily B ATP-binding cassette protein MsbA|nr:ABC transporter ATP-binding protein [Bacteroidales bacterium]HOF15940.1 ABC transporter ATP-binding protein [Bacteroidales bacterium]HOR81282.1 ABC transporter ATP-binding protein [Bacteroidales bacterium]HPJ90549.1 ABC transporter ATP-binding protein [Bacteroidales bacterium]